MGRDAQYSCLNILTKGCLTSGICILGSQVAQCSACLTVASPVLKVSSKMHAAMFAKSPGAALRNILATFQGTFAFFYAY